MVKTTEIRGVRGFRWCNTSRQENWARLQSTGTCVAAATPRNAWAPIQTESSERPPMRTLLANSVVIYLYRHSRYNRWWSQPRGVPPTGILHKHDTIYIIDVKPRGRMHWRRPLPRISSPASPAKRSNSTGQKVSSFQLVFLFSEKAGLCEKS